MRINIRDDSVEIDGYVNAVERLSKLLGSRAGQFRERIKAGAFDRAIKRNDDIHILLNHDWQRDLGSTKQGNLELTEDSIGLRARAVVTDPDVVEKAKRGDLVGWSFGFSDRDVDMHPERGVETRDVKDLDLYEVSILDRSKVPAYDGTLVMTRDVDGESQSINLGEPLVSGTTEDKHEHEPEPEPEQKPESEPESVESKTEEKPEAQQRDQQSEESTDNVKIDYGAWENLIANLKEE